MGSPLPRAFPRRFCERSERLGNVELTGFCLIALVNNKAMTTGKANQIAIAGSGKIPCAAAGCVSGTAHVLTGEPSIAVWTMLGKSLTQPDGGEGYSVMATGSR